MILKTKKKTSNKPVLRVIIVGCGKVGSRLVEILTTEERQYNVDIVVVDQSAARVHKLTDEYDIMGIIGNGVTNSVLEEAGIANTDLLVAVTDSDELNLLVCTVAHRASPCRTIARVRNPEYGDDIEYLREKLNIEMVINPEERSAQEIARILNLPAAESVKSFAHGYAELVKIRISENCLLGGMSLMEFGRDVNRNVLISAVERDGEVVIPSGNFVMQKDDILTVIAAHTDAVALLKQIGLQNNPAKSVLIIGGGRSAYYLAKSMLSVNHRVQIIENKAERCAELAEYLPDAIIINDDGTNNDVLMEAGLPDVDAVVALTGVDEENILLTLQAKNHTNAKLVTKINRMNFRDVVNGLKLGSVVYPKELVTESIVGYIRAFSNSMDNSNVDTVYYICNQRVEVVEFEVKGESAVTNVALKDLKLVPDLLIGGIIREGQLIIPGGNDCILPKDSVIIVTKQKGLDNILGIVNNEL